MRISRERLAAEAENTGFRPEILEKVLHLLSLLEGLRSHPFLKGRLALKGGTALNLFLFNVPRLSVDIDLNYVGAADRETMLAERPKVEDAIRAVCSREGFAVRRIPEDHAGGKWRLQYESALGGRGNLELDLNFMLRVPLWPILSRDSRPIGSRKAKAIPLLDPHELAAGKFAALLARHESRDLFDAHQILNRDDLHPERLRLAFVVYGAMNRKDWRTVSADDVRFDTAEIRDSLVPVLRSEVLADVSSWAARLAEDCRKGLGSLLPFSDTEMEFLNRILDEGKIEPEFLTADEEMAERIRQHPMLHWKAQNVRKFKGAG